MLPVTGEVGTRGSGVAALVIMALIRRKITRRKGIGIGEEADGGE